MEELKNILTKREIEVLKLIIKGLTNGQIADKLTISPDTVKAHISSVLNKLNVKTRTQAAVIAIKAGIDS